MKQLKKLVAVLMMSSMAFAVVGCGNTNANANTTNAEAQNAEPAVALSAEVSEGGGFKLQAPEGWNVDANESGITVSAIENNDSIAGALVAEVDAKVMGAKEYAVSVAGDLEAQAKETGLDMKLVNTDTSKCKAGEVAIFKIEMPFKEEYIEGWLANNTLTQEEIDAAGGKEQFIANTKMTQIQAHILTDKGLLVLSAQTIEDAAAMEEVLKAVLETVELA